MPQSFKSDYLALIRDQGADYNRASTRGHDTSAALAFHSDPAVLTVLLYVRPAARGGEVSVVRYDHAARWLGETDPRALQTLMEEVPFDLREERIFSDSKWLLRPVV